MAVPELNHPLLDIKYGHRAYVWHFANDAARLAETGLDGVAFDATMEGKFARQDGISPEFDTIWMLADYTGPTWAKVGALSASLDDLTANGVDVASAATIDLDAATGDTVDVTGTTTITAITLAEGNERRVRFTGILTLTHGSDLVLPSSANITTAAGDYATFRGYASGAVRCVGYERLTGQALVGGSTTLDAITLHGSDVASAGTIDLDTAASDLIDVTGTTTITAVTLADGRSRTVRFTGVLILTHGASLVLPTGASITTAVGDFAVLRGYAAGVVRCSSYTRADGTALVGTTVFPVCIQAACSDETTALTTGTAKVTFRAPYAFTLTGVRASVTTAPTGGTLLAVDINESGASVLSTVLTFDASEKTTTTAATPAVISDSAIADDAEITIDIDAVGSTIAGAGLKVTLIGTKP